MNKLGKIDDNDQNFKNTLVENNKFPSLFRDISINSSPYKFSAFVIKVVFPKHQQSSQFAACTQRTSFLFHKIVAIVMTMRLQV